MELLVGLHLQCLWQIKFKKLSQKQQFQQWNDFKFTKVLGEKKH